MVSPLIQRIERWAAGLPITESIPVCEGEVFEFAFWLNEGCPTPSSNRLKMYLDQLQKGGLSYHGHRVVVI